MRYIIGVDLHKCSLTATVLDQDGAAIEEKKLATKCRTQIRDFFSRYGREAIVAVESVGFYQWFWDLLEPLVGKVVLADPVGVRAAAGRRTKTDKNDAWLIADLLRSGRLPASYVPAPALRELRQLVRLRYTLGRSLATERRRLRWIGLKANLPGPRVLTSVAAQKWLRAQKEHFSPLSLISAHLFQDHIIRFEREVDQVEAAIGAFLDQHPLLKQRVELLQSIPGIGLIGAVTILAEADPERFCCDAQLVSYAGLAPRVSQSGESEWHGHITKQGPPILRWILQQDAWVAIRSDEHVKRIWRRISHRAGSKKAAVAIARKLLIYARAVLRRNQPFSWPDETRAGTPPTTTQQQGAWCYAI
jgi:transposase